MLSGKGFILYFLLYLLEKDSLTSCSVSSTIFLSEGLSVTSGVAECSYFLNYEEDFLAGVYFGNSDDDMLMFVSLSLRRPIDWPITSFKFIFMILSINFGKTGRASDSTFSLKAVWLCTISI